MTKQPPAQPSCNADDPQWSEEWIDPNRICRLDELQVRRALDQRAVRDYRNRTAAGSAPPPIKLARVPDGRLLLVDGWHRLEAGAIEQGNTFEGDGPGSIRVLVAAMSERQARWQAARANMDHGVPLKPRERRAVLSAFVKAGKHKTGKGQYDLMSYRDMGAALGIGHTTVRHWIRQDFPRLFQSIGGRDGGNPQATSPEPSDVEGLAEAQQREAIQAARSALAGLHAMTPEGRAELVRAYTEVVSEAQRLGVADLGPVF